MKIIKHSEIADQAVITYCWHKAPKNRAHGGQFAICFYISTLMLSYHFHRGDKNNKDKLFRKNKRKFEIYLWLIKPVFIFEITI